MKPQKAIMDNKGCYDLLGKGLCHFRRGISNDRRMLMTYLRGYIGKEESV